MAVIWRGRIVWPSARAWRAREPQGSVGSNPTLSAGTKIPSSSPLGIYCLSRLVYIDPLINKVRKAFSMEIPLLDSLINNQFIPGSLFDIGVGLSPMS